MGTARIYLLSVIVILLSVAVRLRGRKIARRGGAVLLIGAYGNGNFGDDLIGLAIGRVAATEGYRVTYAARKEDVGRLRRSGNDAVIVGGGISSLIATWRAAKDQDVAILGGGGLLESRDDDRAVQRLVLEYVGKLMAAGIRGAVPGVHGIGVAPDLYSRGVVNRAVTSALRAAQFVSVRDEASKAAVDRMGAFASLVQDPATSYLKTLANQRDDSASTLGVVVLDHHRWPSFEKGNVESERKRNSDISDLVDRMEGWAYSGRDVSLVPFHWSDEELLQDLITVFTQRGGNTDRLAVHPYAQTDATEPFLHLMACGAVLTMRFHPALAALTVGADVLVIGELQKLRQLRNSTSRRKEGELYPPIFEDPDEYLRRRLNGVRAHEDS